jgi:DNA-binding protein HU-beta
MAKLSKGDLVAKMAEIASISKAAAEKALDGLIDTITSALKKGTDVALVGFGTFTVSKRKARKGRNPKDGSVVNIPAKKVPKFKAGKSLKEAVNK